MIKIGDRGREMVESVCNKGMYVEGCRFIVVSNVVNPLDEKGWPLGYYYLVRMFDCPADGHIKAVSYERMRMDPKVCDKCGQEIKS